MKVKHLMIAMVAGMAACACSDDKLVLSESTPSQVASAGEGYVSIAINLPTDLSTRASSSVNDVFKDGDACEYAVNDATLLLFYQTALDATTNGEATALYFGSYGLSDLPSEFSAFENVTGQITTKASQTVKIDKPDITEDDHLYALVVLNNSGVITQSGDDSYFGSVKLESGTTTLGALQKTASELDVTTIADRTGNNFYMTNAPLYYDLTKSAYSAPTGGSVHTLAEIDQTHIYTTKDAAEQNVATEVYVERGVAKVTVEETNEMTGSESIGVLTGGATLKAYALDITNTIAFPVRQFDEEWLSYTPGQTSAASLAGTYNAYRFAGNTEAGENLYRTYWGIDPNYAEENEVAVGTTAATNEVYTHDTDNQDPYRKYTTIDAYKSSDEVTWTEYSTDSDPTPLYCLENTTDVADMNNDQLTRLLFKVELNAGEDFYSASKSGVTALYADGTNETNTIDDLKKLILSVFFDDEVIAAAVIEAGYSTSDEINFDDYLSAVDISSATSATDLQYTITQSDIDILSGVSASDFAAALANTIKALQVDYYKDGICYYSSAIKHFGDDLTPWAETDNSDGTSYGNPESEENWLGRWGVLRNNWYHVAVGTISHVGSPDIPPVYDDDPADPVEAWILTEVRILSWAYRVQDVSF